jgi:hypothetical protein
MLRQSKLLKACQEKLKCQTMGIDFSDEVERSICPFQRIDLQVAEIKDPKKQPTARCNNYVALFRA